MGRTRFSGPVKSTGGFEVGAEGGSPVNTTIIDSSGNLYQAGTLVTATAAELNILDGVQSTAAELNILDGVQSTAAELDSFLLTVDMTDISAATSVWVVSPYAATIEKIYSVINGAITLGDATITAEIGGTLVTGSSIIIANVGSGAGIVDSSTPSAANTVTAGQAIEIITDGGSTDTCRATFTLVMQRT